MASLMQWANEPWSGELPFEYGFRPRGLPEHPTKLQVMACLSKMSISDGCYGFSENRGIYGRTGLDQQEAFVWWDLKSFVAGWIRGTDGAEANVFFAAIKAEHERVAALSPESQDS